MQLIDNRQGILDADTDGIEWFTVCVDHGGCVGHPTRRLAEEWLSHPEDWCPACQGEELP